MTRKAWTVALYLVTLGVLLLGLLHEFMHSPIDLLFAKRGGAARCDLKLPRSTDHLVATPSTRGAAPSAGQIPAAPE